MNLTINPVCVARFKMDKGMMTYFANYGQTIWIPIMAWLIKHPDGDVLVDAGAYADDMLSYFGEAAEDVQTVEEALAQYDETVDDIKHLVMTHLHFDHALNARKYKNATVYVQKTEYEFSYNPHPMFSVMYDPKFLEGMPIELIEGEREIVPGVCVFPVPGHTPGTQAVEVDTEKGKAIITGFCCDDDVFPEGGGMTPGIHSNSLDAFDSVRKVTERADIIIAQHDPKYEFIKQIP